MAERKPHLSISALNMLSRCGEQYRRRYLEGDILPPGIAALVGRGVHKTVAENLRTKIETKKLLPVEALSDITRDAVNTEFETAEILLTPEEAANPKQAKGLAVDKAIRLSATHGSDIAPGLDPVAVERQWRLEIDGFPRDLMGFIDVVEPTRLRDTKTVGKSPQRDAAHTSDQLTMYALAVSQIDGKAPESVHLDYLVDTKTPKAVSLGSSRGPVDFRVLLRRIEAAVVVIEKELFLPAPQDSWQCQERYCGYASTCPFFRRSARPKN